MPKVRILVFLFFIFLFAAIPFLGKKEERTLSMPLFQSIEAGSYYQFVK